MNPTSHPDIRNQRPKDFSLAPSLPPIDDFPTSRWLCGGRHERPSPPRPTAGNPKPSPSVCSGDRLTYTATVSYFADGQVAEIFVSNHKTGSNADCAAKDAAILASLALQFGAPLETLRNALLRDHQGHAITPVGAALDRLAEEKSS